jgi:hypothetical protein
MTKEKKIKIFLLIILTGFISSVFYHYILSNYLHKGIPYNTFLFLSNDQFKDFINVYHSRSSVYFPFGNLIINLFCLIKPIELSLIFFQLISVSAIFYYFYKNLAERSKLDSITNSVIFCLFSFPILFLIDRANFESFVVIFLGLFIYLYQKGEVNYSVLPLSCAIAMKLFPAVFLVLLFSDRKYRQIGWTIFLVIILTLLSSWILYGGIIEYFSQLAHDTDFYQKFYVIGDKGTDYGHSLFVLIKLIVLKFNPVFDISFLLKPYAILVLILFFLISVYITLIEKSFWKKTALLVFAMCLLPYVSANYKLTYLFIPITFFINSNDTDNNTALFFKNKLYLNKINVDYLYIFLFGLLIIPKNYRLFIDLYDGVYLDPIIMIMFSILILFSGLINIKYKRKEISDKIKFLLFRNKYETNKDE